METLVDLIGHRIGYTSEEERDSWWKEDLVKTQKDLVKTLDDEQKELFESFKCCFINHLQSINSEDYKLYTYYALKIGQEYQELLNAHE